MSEDTAQRFLRPTAVIQRTGLSSTSLWRLRKAGKFPQPVKLGEKAVGWLESEVSAWQASRIAERDAA